MSTKNKITLDFLGNAELKEYFASKTAGDSFTLTVEGTFGSATDESMTGSLDEVTLPEGADLPEDDTDTESDGMRAEKESMMNLGGMEDKKGDGKRTAMHIQARG